MPYKPFDIFQDLPKTNCGYCGKPGCLPFAMSVHLEGTPVSACPQLSSEKAKQIQDKVDAEKKNSSSDNSDAVMQAMTFRMDMIRKMDLKDLSEKSDTEYIEGPEKSIKVYLFNIPFIVSNENVIAENGKQPSITVKVFLLIYLTSATGETPLGEWVAYRELPNSVSKSRQFEETVGKLGLAFGGRKTELKDAALKLGGKEVEQESADLAFEFNALPCVPIKLIFWDKDEDFEARASVLLDKSVVNYLDLEAALFMVESFVALIKGEDINELDA